MSACSRSRRSASDWQESFVPAAILTSFATHCGILVLSSWPWYRRYPPLIGGAEKVLSYLAGALAAEGADVTVAHLAGTRAEARRARGNADRGIERCQGRDPSILVGYRIVRLKTSGCGFGEPGATCETSSRWFQENPVDLAYVSMLKHDAYSCDRRWRTTRLSGRASA